MDKKIVFCVTVGPGDEYQILLENFLYHYCNNIYDGIKNIDLYVHCNGQNKINNPYYCTDIINICKKISSKYEINIICTNELVFGLEGALDGFIKNIIYKINSVDWIVFLDVDLFIVEKEWFNKFNEIIQNNNISCFGEFLPSNYIEKQKSFVASRFYTSFFGICVKDFIESNTTFNPIYNDKIISDRLGFFGDVGTHVLFDLLKKGKHVYDIGPLLNYKNLFMHIGASGVKLKKHSAEYDQDLQKKLINIKFYDEINNDEYNISDIINYYKSNKMYFNKELENWDILCQKDDEWNQFIDRIKYLKIKNILTIGVNNGGGVLSLSKYIDKESKIINIDFDIGNFNDKDMRNEFFKKMVNLTQEVKNIDKNSFDIEAIYEVDRFLNGEKLDLIFIDADHSYDGVKRDFENYYSFLNKNGIICFHDIFTHEIDDSVSVNKFWEEIVKKFKTEEIRTKENNALGIGIMFNEIINSALSKIEINYPPEIELEVTSRCNLRCVQCSQSWTPDENKMDISEEVLNNMKPALSKAKAVSLHGIGEPLLANNFWEVINAINPEAHISFHSNMTIMNKNIADKLTDGRVKLIDISLDAATEETYRKIRGANFSRAIENIDYLISVKNDKKSFLPKLRINMTLMRENIDELKDFILLAKDLNIDTVHVWRMNEDWYPPKVSNKYFDFVYSEQTLSNHKELFNTRIRESIDLSKEIGINFILDSSLFDI